MRIAGETWEEDCAVCCFFSSSSPRAPMRVCVRVLDVTAPLSLVCLDSLIVASVCRSKCAEEGTLTLTQEEW